MQLGEGLEQDKTDFDRLRNMSDDDIDCNDIPELTAEFWKDAKLVMPEEKKQLTIRLDNDVLEWFKSQGKGYQTRINTVLRSYYEAHERSGPRP